MFVTVHVHSAIYKKQGLLTSAGKDIKNKEEILALLESIWPPKVVALVHCKGHQKGDSPKARGNWAIDETAQEADLKPVGPLQILMTLPDPDLPTSPAYTEKEERLTTQKQPSMSPKGWPTFNS